MACMQYYYENPEDAQKYAINCENKIVRSVISNRSTFFCSKCQK